MHKNQIQSILKTYRKDIDQLDDDIIVLLVKRFDIITQVAQIKGKHNIPTRLDDRVDEVINRNIKNAAKVNLDPKLIASLWESIVDSSIDLEEYLIKKQ